MAYKITLRTDTAANWSSSNPVLLLGEMGHESDTDKIKLGDGVTAWSSLSYYAEAVSNGLTSSDIGSTIQAYDANLTAVAALTSSEGNFIVGNGSTFVTYSGPDTRTILGYGTLASQNTFAPTDLGETLSVAKGGTGSTTAGDARTALGLVIDTDVESYNANVSTDSNIGSTIQAYDSNLTSFVSTFTLPTTDGTASYGVKTDGSATIGFAQVSAGLTVANTADDLPESPSSGESAYVVDEDAFYVWNGSAWRYFTLSEYSSGPAWVFQGSNYGYASGGGLPLSNVIDKFPFAAIVNTSDVGDLTSSRRTGAGQSSASYGYTSGGSGPSNVIEKFPFSTDANASDVGDLTIGRFRAAGNSSSTHGYTTGGITPTATNVIDKFPVSTDANATDVGDLTQNRSFASSQSSTTHGYSSLSTAIDKFPFSTDTNATDVGDLSVDRDSISGGQSSSTHGYISGGVQNVIDKFPFATDTNATDVGDLTGLRTQTAGQSSTTNGYVSGGYFPTAGTYLTTIDKFPFSTNANATDVGDLTVARREAAGHQY